MTHNSEFTFRNLMKGDFNYIKVIWNKIVIFDDDREGTTYKTIDRMLDVIEDKVIYSAKIDIVQFHHCIITIIGEDLSEKELAVIEGEIVNAK